MMDEWMNGGCVDGWVWGWMDRWVNVCIDG